MSRIDNHNYYTTAIARHGNSAQGVHWNSQDTQYKRFEVLLGMLGDLEASEIVAVGQQPRLVARGRIARLDAKHPLAGRPVSPRQDGA